MGDLVGGRCGIGGSRAGLSLWRDLACAAVQPDGPSRLRAGDAGRDRAGGALLGLGRAGLPPKGHGGAATSLGVAVPPCAARRAIALHTLNLARRLVLEGETR